jgi:uncharacterized protein (TIGR02246 family)
VKGALTIIAAFAVLLGAKPARTQNMKAVEQAVTAVATEWNRAWNAHDLDALMALFDAKPAGQFILSGTAYAPDSLRAVWRKDIAGRTNDAWTVDHARVIVLDEHSALLQITFSGHFTAASGVSWEYKSSAFVTALVQKRGDKWKITAFQNSGAGKQVAK